MKRRKEEWITISHIPHRLSHYLNSLVLLVFACLVSTCIWHIDIFVNESDWKGGVRKQIIGTGISLGTFSTMKGKCWLSVNKSQPVHVAQLHRERPKVPFSLALFASKRFFCAKMEFDRNWKVWLKISISREKVIELETAPLIFFTCLHFWWLSLERCS